MLKVLAVNPVYPGAPEIRYLPLGFGYILSIVRKKHELRLLDMLNGAASWRDLDRELARGDYDVLLMGGFAMQVWAMREVARRARAASSKTKIVIGGVGVSDIPEIALNYTGADAVAMGEAEPAIEPMLDSIEAGAPFEGVPTFAFRHGGAVIKNPKGPLVRNLDEIGMPAYDLFDVEHICQASYNGWGYRSMFLESSRGCPFRCDFCINSVLNDKAMQTMIFGGATERNSSLRLQSVDSLAAEVRFLKDRYGINDVVFTDEEFMTQKQRVFEVSEAMKPLGVTWLTSGRADWATRDKLQSMKEGGCRGIVFGVETGSQTMMNLMVKSAKKDRVINGLNSAREVGISFLANFMIGHPGETAETIEESVEFCRDMDLVYLPSYTTLFPNSKMFHERKTLVKSWDHYFETLSRIQFTSNLFFNLTDLPNRQLMKLRNRAIGRSVGFKLLGKHRPRLVAAATPAIVGVLRVAEQLPPKLRFLLRNLVRSIFDLKSPAARQIPPNDLGGHRRARWLPGIPGPAASRGAGPARPLRTACLTICPLQSHGFSITLVGLALNEEALVVAYVERAEALLRSLSTDFELLIVNDGFHGPDRRAARGAAPDAAVDARLAQRTESRDGVEHQACDPAGEQGRVLLADDGLVLRSDQPGGGSGRNRTV